MNILIGYLTHYGSTRQYAEWIHQDVQGDLLDLQADKHPDFARYDVIVFGGSIHAGRIRCAPIVKKHWAALQEKSVVVFSTSGTLPDHPEIQKIYAANFPEAIRAQIRYFPLPGRFWRKDATLMDKVAITIASKLVRDPEMSAGMQAEYDNVKREHIIPLVNFINSLHG